MNKSNTLNTQEQARFDAITNKYMSLFEESNTLNVQANNILKPFKKGEKAMTGKEWFDSQVQAKKLQSKARKLYKEAQSKVQAEFWNI